MQNVSPDADKRSLVSTTHELRNWIRNVKLLGHVSILL